MEAGEYVARCVVMRRGFTIAYCLMAAITVFWGIAAFTAT